MARKRNLWRRAANSSLADLGKAIRGATYNMVRPLAMAEFARELNRKDYSELGQTEISARIGDMFAEQSPENLQTLARLYETHPWVFICTSYISTQLAGIPLRIMKAAGFEDGREVLEGADDSPVGKMFRWINPYQSPYEFVESLIAWYILTGEAYIVYASPGPDTPKGVPAEMYVLFSPFVTKITSPVHGVIGYEYNISGQKAFFSRDEVVYLGAFSPAGRFRGQGVPAASIQTIITDQSLRQFNRQVLDNGVHLSGVLETDDDQMDVNEAQAVRDSFNKQYGGSSNAAKIAVLWGGLKFSPQTILQKDVMMDKQLDTNRNEIIAGFGLKPELLSDKFANKATAETVRRMALEDTILGRYGRKVESVFSSTGLVRFDPDLRAVFDTRDVPALQTSNKEKTETGALAIQSGQMTINEARTRLHGLQPIPGIEGEVTFIGNQPAAIAMNPPEPSTGKPTKVLTGTAMGGLIKSAENMNIVVKATDDQFRVVFNRTRTTAQNRLERALRSTYREMQKNVISEITRSTVDVTMMAKIEQIMFFDGKNAIVKNVSDSVRLAVDESIQANLAMLQIETVFDVKPVRALGRLTQQEQRIRKGGAKSWTKLRRSLGEGLSGGETQHELTVRVRKHFGGLRNNAETIARTEILPAVNGAAFDVAVSARDAGVDVRFRWVTSQSERVRTPARGDDKNHVLAHGLEIIPGEEMFVVSGQKLEYPGDSWNGASADNTINCECGVQNFVYDPDKE